MNLRGQQGYAMAVLLVGLSVMAIMLTVAMPVWKQETQREKEAELVFRGQQYARAIGLYGRKYANAMPPSIDVLVEQRFLRKKFKDPITNGDFQVILQGQVAPGSTPTGPSRGSATPGGAATNPIGGGRGGPTTSSLSTSTNGPVGGVSAVASKSKDKSIRIYNGR